MTSFALAALCSRTPTALAFAVPVQHPNIERARFVVVLYGDFQFYPLFT